jgi:hypothetical protein
MGIRFMLVLTVQSDDGEDEDEGEDENDNGVDLEAGRLVSVEPCRHTWSVNRKYHHCLWVHILSMVLLLPPAPAARVLLGLALAIFSFWSAAARRRMAVRGPPGGVGDEGRATAPDEAPTGVPTGEEARGEDCVDSR